MSTTLRTTPALAALMLAALTLALTAGCTKDDPGGGTGGGGGGGTPKPTRCDSNTDCGDAERCELSRQVCVAKCTADNQCGSNTGLRCDEQSGECVTGTACSKDAQCQAAASYCSIDEPCACVDDTSVGENKTGVCRRPAKTCEPCADSKECGESAVFDKPGACRSYTVGGNPEKVCLPKSSEPCPAGMLASGEPGLEDVCVPQGGDCGTSSACRGDVDCKDPSKPLCDLVRQVCVSGCRFDFAEGESLGCAPNMVCNAIPAGVDPALLDRCETAPTFGRGQCRQPCTRDETCQEIDPGWVCQSDGDDGLRRCRPVSCLSDAECDTGGERGRGFCDVATGECSRANECRIGRDLRAGCDVSVPYDDCTEQYKCVAGGDPGFGTCEKKNCLELSHSNNGCPPGNFCIGADFTDPVTGKPTGQKVEFPGVSFPPGTCVTLDQIPDGMETWCNNASGSSSCSPNSGANASCCRPSDADCSNNLVPGLVSPTDHPDTPPVCTISDLQYFTCKWGCESQAECPSSWNCSSVGQEFECTGSVSDLPVQLCEQDADCAGESRCVEPMAEGRPGPFTAGRHFKVCECSAKEECGAGYSCNAGVGTVGRVEGRPTFDKVSERYCMKNERCGAHGSCEWFGAFVDAQGGPVPNFFCADAPSSVSPKAPTCPRPEEIAGGVRLRPGRLGDDRFKCVRTSVCNPSYTADPNNGSKWSCGYVNP